MPSQWKLPAEAYALTRPTFVGVDQAIRVGRLVHWRLSKRRIKLVWSAKSIEIKMPDCMY